MEMKDLKKFQDFVRALENYRFIIPNFYNMGGDAYSDHDEEGKILSADIYDERIISLGLSTNFRLGMNFSTKSEVTLEDLLNCKPFSFTPDFPVYNYISSDTTTNKILEGLGNNHHHDCDFYKLPNNWEKVIERLVIERDRYEILKKHLSQVQERIRTYNDIDTLHNLPSPVPSKSMGQLYGEHVSSGDFKVEDILGEIIPYVRTNSNIIMDTGRVDGGLYFVSTDIANEPWKEQAVAYHEHFCQRKGHKYALKQEQKLVARLGKNKEWLEWRKKINLTNASG